MSGTGTNNDSSPAAAPADPALLGGCIPGWSNRSHFFPPGYIQSNGEIFSCYTHEPTMTGLQYTAYVLGILTLLLCLYRILKSIPIILFCPLGPKASAAKIARWTIQGVLFNTTLEMICIVALETAALWFDGILYSSNFMTAIHLIFFLATCLDSFLYLRVTVTSALVGVKAFKDGSQERRTRIVNTISIVLHLIQAIILSVGIIGIRTSPQTDFEMHVAFARLQFCGSILSSLIITSLGAVHTTIIINALVDHVKTAKAVGAEYAKFKEVIKRLSQERVATVILLPFLIFIIATTAVPKIMTYAFPVTHIWVALLGLAGSSTPPPTVEGGDRTSDATATSARDTGDSARRTSSNV